MRCCLRVSEIGNAREEEKGDAGTYASFKNMRGLNDWDWDLIANGRIDRQRATHLGPRPTLLPARDHNYNSRSQIDTWVCDMLGKLHAITTPITLQPERQFILGSYCRWKGFLATTYADRGFGGPMCGLERESVYDKIEFAGLDHR